MITSQLTKATQLADSKNPWIYGGKSPEKGSRGRHKRHNIKAGCSKLGFLLRKTRAIEVPVTTWMISGLADYRDGYEWPDRLFIVPKPTLSKFRV
jgi:hypothetical protein